MLPLNPIFWGVVDKTSPPPQTLADATPEEIELSTPHVCVWFFQETRIHDGE